MTTQPDHLHSPDWVRDAVFYQIFPDRFRKGSESWDVDPHSPVDRRPCSGNLAGIRQSIPYLKDLGITALYLTPIFHASTYHKYDTLDYFTIDPSLGDNEEFRALVDGLHQSGIRIVLDGVFNHCSDQHPFFLDAVNPGPASEYWDWFTINGERIVCGPEPNYACWAGVKSMPEWNHDNPAVWEYLLSVVSHWIREYKIDGWRLDTTEYLPPDFVKDVRRVAKEENPDTYILGEVMGLGTPWFRHQAVDGVMHYKLWEALVEFFANESWDAKTFAASLYGIWNSYPEAANHASYTLLGSHDKPRFLTLCSGDPRRLALAAAFQFTYPGAPAIYYGDEIGLQGGEDPDNRRCFPWNEGVWNHHTLATFRNLVHLRRKERALRRGIVRPVLARDRLVVYEREHQSERILIALNADQAASASVPLESGCWIDLARKKPASNPLSIPPLNYRIVKRTAV